MGYGRLAMGRASNLDGCGSCMKYLLFAFNLLVLIGGLAIAIIGIIAVVTDDYYRFDDFKFENSNLFKSAAFIQIVVGFLIVLFAFLGCCGAIKESKCLLFTYALLTMLVFILLLTAGILAVVFKTNLKEIAEKELTETIKEYNPNDSSLKQAWDKLQIEGKCCGLNNYTDWSANAAFAGLGPNDKRFPKSCCQDIGCDQSLPGNAFEKGCFQLINDILDFSSALGYVAIAIAIIMLVGIIFAFGVGCSL